MTKGKTAAIILAAGKGTRMKSALPKVLHRIAGRPMVGHVLDAVTPLKPDRVVVVVGPGMEDVAAAVAPHPTVLQAAQQGTADAVRVAAERLAGMRRGTILILYGDTPLIATATLRRMLARRARGDAIVVLGFRPADPTGYGRLVTGTKGALHAIVEHADATREQRDIGLCNSGVMAVDAAHLFDLAGRVGNDNAKGEYYLTDIVALARADGLAASVVEAPVAELMGVDSRAALARAEAAWQAARRERAMTEGTTLLDPATVWFSHDTKLGRDVTIGPNVVFGPGVEVADGAEIKAFCHFEGAAIGPGATVGPFARLRPGTRLDAGVKIGNFVEVKNAVLGPRAQANHLTYIGDAEIGERVNVGAGTITCNYDGFAKHRTVIGSGAFIGSNTALVAPVTVGKDAIVGAGSTITRDVADDALAVARGAQVDMPGRAAVFRDMRRPRGKAPARTSGGTGGKG